ncbi:MAG: hypothetical protein ACI89J_002860 [Hyphomicrobiaceae bacterium]|jgi:hypothetical protein
MSSVLGGSRSNGTILLGKRHRCSVIWGAADIFLRVTMAQFDPEPTLGAGLIAPQRRRESPNSGPVRCMAYDAYPTRTADPSPFLDSFLAETQVFVLLS